MQTLSKLVLIVSLLFFQRWAQAEDICRGAFSTHAQNQIESLQKKYFSLDAQGTVSTLNQTYYREGDSHKLVFLLHGFLGSPDEMRPIADRFSAKGYSVYAPLLPGMGSTATIGNAYTKEMWRAWLKKEMDAAARCFDQIYVVSFSTGATLWNDYLHTGEHVQQIAGGVMLSPYFATHDIFIATLQAAGSALMTHIDVAALFKVAGFPEVLIMLQKPESYMHDVPLQMTQQIVDLGKLNQSYLNIVDTPILIMNSADDALVNQNATDTVTDTLIHRSYVQFKTHPRTPHHLMVPGYSPVAQQVTDNTVNYILWH